MKAGEHTAAPRAELYEDVNDLRAPDNVYEIFGIRVDGKLLMPDDDREFTKVEMQALVDLINAAPETSQERDRLREAAQKLLALDDKYKFICGQNTLSLKEFTLSITEIEIGIRELRAAITKGGVEG